ncbi:MAG: hypothetical protein GY714_24360 [Desulfobacterales bacterium]|nr:hypothetical protein [Desulfobacterales bacterium]
MNERYQNKPLLKLLECYILFSIGEILKDEKIKMDEMTPKLRQLYNLEGEWNEIIEKIMDFPSDMPKQILDVWEKNCNLAELNDEEINPQDFAEMFADQNFI